MEKRTVIIIIAIVVVVILAFSIYKFTGGVLFLDPPEGCSETDNGRDIYTKGMTSFSNRDKGHTDVCANKWEIREYFCLRDIMITAERDRCLKGCVDGACVA